MQALMHKCMHLGLIAWWRRHQSARTITMTLHASLVGGGGVAMHAWLIYDPVVVVVNDDQCTVAASSAY